MVLAAESAGAAMVELGMPFSDPLADGPVIQASSQQAIENGVNITWILETVTKIREKSEIPIALMGYINPILKYGVDKFLYQCKKCGVDGLLIPDLPPEEGMEIFPCPVEPDKAVEPVANADALTLQSVFPTVNRCTKCGSCTTACPMSIPVMDSVMRMQEGSFDKVAEDFTTCIHCGLCRFVCEDKVKPHSMGLWIRRSFGKSQVELKIDVENSDRVEKEWQYLLVEGKQERMQRAKIFRESGGLPE